MANAKLITQVSGAIHNKAQFPTIIQALEGCKYYAYIFHDKDEGKDIHLHFVAQDRHSLKKWASLFDIPENMIEIPRNFRAVNRYLIHLDDSEKFLYNKSDVKTNRPTRFESYLSDNQEIDSRTLFDDLRKVREGRITHEDFIEKYKFWLNQQSFYSQFKIISELLKWSNYE